MSLLSKLFGGKTPQKSEPVEYKDFRIFPAPEKVGGQYRVQARIELDVDGETKVHHLIRADTIASLDEATDVTINKAKQVINEQGAGLFG